jgi:TonB family protein
VESVRVRVAIDASGEVRETTVANPSESRESAERAVLAAVRRSFWRPAFQDGQPVAVNDYLFSERVFVKLPKAE